MTDRNQQTTPPQDRVGLLAGLARDARLVWRLLMDSRVATATKFIIPGIVALYVLSPIDLVPDWMLGLGQLDDLAVLVLAVKLFIELCPPDIVREHRTGMARNTASSAPRSGTTTEGEVVDADYRIIE